MAKTFALRRATAQPETIDTITVQAGSLGAPIPGMQITPVFPARCVNLYTVFAGDPYLLVVSAIGDIEIHVLVGGAWSLTAGPFSPPVGHVITPICLRVINNTLVALWSDEGGANDGISVTTSTNGSSWTTPTTELAPIGSSRGGPSITYRLSIWFTTSIGLWCYAPFSRFVNLAGIAGSYTVDEQVIGSVSLTSATVRSFNSPLLRLDAVAGTGFIPGETLTGVSSGSTGTVTTVTSFVNPAPDIGNNGNLGSGLQGASNALGSFARWDGSLYFVQPKTPGGPTRFWQLDSAWEAPLKVPAPQWTEQTYSGLVDAGFATLGDDAGLWSLFVNKTDELCLFYSASGSTKLAKTTSKTLPMMFTDLTNSLLPVSIASKTNLGVTLYTDDRRRDNVLHNLIIRDTSAGATIVTTWDGISEVEIKGTLPGVDYMLPADQRGQESTFTNLQPACQMTLSTQSFPGRIRLDYIVRSSPARTMDIVAEYSVLGDRWFPMTEGDGSSGTIGLPASPIGTPYFFNWDAFADLDGDLNNVEMRIVPRISGA